MTGLLVISHLALVAFTCLLITEGIEISLHLGHSVVREIEPAVIVTLVLSPIFRSSWFQET